MEWFPKYNFILASKSPRRQQLLSSLGISFEVRIKEVDEVFPPELTKEEVPVYLAEKKASAFTNEIQVNDLLISADTVVCLGNEILGKPSDYNEAFNMIQKLSGKEHEVITGVCLSSKSKSKSFFSSTTVCFKQLSYEEIDFYIREFRPFDKAGAYGIQEWIGAIGIEHIKGSFYNVMGLPIQKLYEKILKF